MKEPTESKRTGDRSPDLATWKSTTLAASVAKVLPRKSTFTTLSGLPIEELYTEAHVGVSEPTKGLGFPGEYPFTRGVHPVPSDRGLPPLPSVGIAITLDSDRPAPLVRAFAEHVRLVLPTI